MPPIEEEKRWPTSFVPLMVVMPMTLARHLKKVRVVSAGQRVLQNLCPHTMWWVQAEGEEFPIMGTVGSNSSQYATYFLNYQKCDTKP